MLVCAKCMSQMRVLKNGVSFVQVLHNGDPYKLWSGDLYTCKECNNQTIAGFGKKPVMIFAYGSSEEKWETINSLRTLTFVEKI